MHPRRNSPGFVLFFADYSHEICGVGGGGGVGQQRSRALVHMRLLDEMCVCVLPYVLQFIYMTAAASFA